MQWDAKGLVPAIVQDSQTQGLLMMAWMNQEALAATFETQIVHFYSRSRQCLWKKGETSGNLLHLVSMRTDCDADVLLVQARPEGPSCHTNRRSCFYRRIQGDATSATIEGEDEGPAGAASAIVDRLYEVLCERRDHGSAERSYTQSLLEKGFPKIEAKISEESGELLEVLAEGDAGKVVHESADLLFHVLVGLCARKIDIADLWRELDRRFGTGGHQEKASRSQK